MVKGYTLTFIPNCVSNKTSGGQFLSCTTQQILSTKHQKLANCNHIITLSIGTDITLNQCIMAIKTQQDYKSPLFLGVDTKKDSSLHATRV